MRINFHLLSLTHFLWTKAHPRSLYHPLELCISSKSSMEVFWYISKYMVTSLHHFAVFRRDLCLLPAVGLYLTHAVNPLEQAFAIGPCLFKPFICLSPLPFTLSEDSGCILISADSIHAKYTLRPHSAQTLQTVRYRTYRTSARFTKQGKLVWECNLIKALMGVESFDNV